MDKKLKILLICKALPFSFKGGIETHVWELAKNLVKKNLEVAILTAGSFKKGTTENLNNGIRVIKLSYFPGRKIPFLSVFLEEFCFNFSVRYWLIKNCYSFDIIHLQGRSGYLFKNLKTKDTPQYINTVHRLSVVEKKWARSELKGFLDAFLYYPLTIWLEKIAIKKSDGIIAISQEVEKELAEYIKTDYKTPEIIYNGIEIEDVPEIKPNLNQLIFVGRLTKIKGIFPLIDCMALVNNRIQLIMVGDGPSREELQKFIKQKGLEHRIKLLGSKDKSEVLALIKASYALILPSYHESLGIVLLEALSLGRPVIGSNVPGIDEIIINDKNGLLFEAGNTEQMARCINRIFSNGEFYEQLAKWGKKDVLNRFNWNHITNQTVEKYQKMLSP